MFRCRQEVFLEGKFSVFHVFLGMVSQAVRQELSNDKLELNHFKMGT